MLWKLENCRVICGQCKINQLGPPLPPPFFFGARNSWSPPFLASFSFTSKTTKGRHYYWYIFIEQVWVHICRQYLWTLDKYYWNLFSKRIEWDPKKWKTNLSPSSKPPLNEFWIYPSPGGINSELMVIDNCLDQTNCELIIYFYCLHVVSNILL